MPHTVCLLDCWLSPKDCHKIRKLKIFRAARYFGQFKILLILFKYFYLCNKVKMVNVYMLNSILKYHICITV